MAGYLALWSVYWLFRLLTGKEALGYGDFKLLAALGAGAAGRFCRRCCCSLRQRAGVDPTATPVDRQSLQQPLAFGPGWRWPAGVFSLAADGLAFANRLAGQNAARQRRLRVFFAAAGRGGVGRIVRQTCFG